MRWLPHTHRHRSKSLESRSSARLTQINLIPFGTKNLSLKIAQKLKLVQEIRFVRNSYLFKAHSYVEFAL